VVNGSRLIVAGILATVLLASVIGGAFAIRSSALNASANELSNAREATRESDQQAAAANELVMQLLASDDYELTSDQFNQKLIPTYESQYDAIHKSGGPMSNEDRTVYGILAVLKAISGDFDRADVLLDKVADSGQRDEMRRVREKICSEFATTAKKRLQQLSAGEDNHERAVQQVTLGRCYILWGMLDDAEQLLKDAIAFFDTAQPNSYESLVARVALAKVFERAGKHSQRVEILAETHQKFSENQHLLATPRGREAFARIVKTLVESSPDDFGHLQHSD